MLDKNPNFKEPKQRGHLVGKQVDDQRIIDMINLNYTETAAATTLSRWTACRVVYFWAQNSSANRLLGYKTGDKHDRSYTPFNVPLNEDPPECHSHLATPENWSATVIIEAPITHFIVYKWKTACTAYMPVIHGSKFMFVAGYKNWDRHNCSTLRETIFWAATSYRNLSALATAHYCGVSMQIAM